jgi:uncharacterized protein
MLLADSNIWLALALSKHIFHDVASTRFAARRPRERVAFCRVTQLSFLRLLTTGAVTEPYGVPALSNAAAWALYERFRDQKRVTFLEEPSSIDSIWQEIADRPTASPKLWMDAYLAAFAIAGRHRLVTTDSAFRQFSKLDLQVLSR